MTEAELIDALVAEFGGERAFAAAIPPASRRVILRWANGSKPVQAEAWTNIRRALGELIAAEHERLAALAGEVHAAELKAKQRE